MFTAARRAIFKRCLSARPPHGPSQSPASPSTTQQNSEHQSSMGHHEPEYKPIVGPGRDPSHIATPYESTAGLERLEYLSNMSGRPLYLNEPLKVDHYGTLQNPIVVDSLEEERVVGCTGFPKYSHAPMWMRLTGTMRCVECGQAFRIRRVD